LNSIITKIFSVILSLALLLYVGLQLFSWIYNPIKTESALSYSVDDSVDSKGYIIRDEQLITANINGILDYSEEDGAKVASGSNIAAVYSSEQDVEAESKIRQLNSQIDELQMFSNSGNSNDVDSTMIDRQISQLVYKLAAAKNGQNLTDAFKNKNELLGLINHKQIIMDKVSNFNDRIKQLTKERDNLSKSINKKISAITTPKAGYFVSSVDGYETLLLPKNAFTISVNDINQFDKMKVSNSSKNVIGKVIGNYSWYYVCVLPFSISQKIKIGDSLFLRFSFASSINVPVTVTEINKADNGQAAFIFSGDYMSQELALARTQPVQVIIHSYSGLRVNKNSIRIVNGEKGVYVKNGQRVNFKKINAIYSNDSFSISKPDDTNQGTLRLYDEIIVGGGNLYDGKIIK
jgi:hypothetical protein